MSLKSTVWYQADDIASGMSAIVDARDDLTNRGLDMCRQCFREKVSFGPYIILSRANGSPLLSVSSRLVGGSS